jgi:rhamnopyranosyl-N-acetylglucosaminyl-diphospho-decaprenol beta-1,3/1,4-galactofuranosyltransferase
MAGSPESAARDGVGTVCAVVVTHDRRELLRECLTALGAQTRPLDSILVVDSASTDGTAAMLAEDFPRVDVHRLDTNQGGAGGFHEGIRAAHARGFGWLWLMDDDTIPEPDALERLVEGHATATGLGRPPAMLSSKVVWTDGRLHPMNTALPALRQMDDLVDAASHGLLMLRSASFVSLLLDGRAVERYGLPIKRYFIWSDDVEYTARILRWEPGYLVPTSVVEHKTADAYLSWSGPPERYFFHVRNSIYMTRSSAWDLQEKLRVLWMLLINVRQFLAHKRWSPSALAVVARGLIHGVTTPADDRGPSRG